MAIVLGRKQNNNYNSRYVLTLQAQLVKSANLMEQFKFRSDNIILLANQASAITEKAQKDLQQCRTAGWHVF
jgi:DNA invertase Pin-like site-specific DNA recombinase